MHGGGCSKSACDDLPSDVLICQLLDTEAELAWLGLANKIVTPGLCETLL